MSGSSLKAVQMIFEATNVFEADRRPLPWRRWSCTLPHHLMPAEEAACRKWPERAPAGLRATLYLNSISIVVGAAAVACKAWSLQARATNTATGEVRWSTAVSVAAENADEMLQRSRLVGGLVLLRHKPLRACVCSMWSAAGWAAR
jgi:hypothetical protein